MLHPCSDALLYRLHFALWVSMQSSLAVRSSALLGRNLVLGRLLFYLGGAVWLRCDAAGRWLVYSCYRLEIHGLLQGCRYLAF